MADEIPQIQNSQPIFNPVKIESGAESHEEFAKVLGSLATKSEEKAEEIASDQSQAMYVNSVADAEHIKNKAQEQMLENPGQANKIRQSASDALDTIGNDAFVNSKDRGKLNAYLKTKNDDIELDAVKTNVKQRQLDAGFTYFSTFNDKMNAYYDALVSDPQKAQQLHDALLGETRSHVLAGSLTVTQGANAIKTMSNMVDAVHDLHRAGYDNNTTAKDYHALTSNPLRNEAGNPESPMNEGTNWLIDHYSNDKSLQGALSDVSNRIMPNPKTFLSLPPNEREHVIQAINGTKIADGFINSGEPFPSMQKEYQLLSEKGRTLNYEQESTRNALGNWIKDLQNGNYLQVMAKTPQGNGIMRDFVQNNAAIESTYAYSPEGKQAALLQNQNNMVNRMVSLGHARHIPGDLINPIPVSDIAVAQNAFNFGQKPEDLLQTLGHYSKENQLYVANALKEPNQKMVTQALALSGNDVSVQTKLEFIAANQSGQPGIGKSLQGSNSDKVLMARISDNLSNQLRLVGRNYGYEAAPALQNAMLQSTLKYAKYLAYRDNNIPMTDSTFDLLSTASWKKYVDKASQIYSNSFQQMSGTNWVINKSQLPHPMTESDMDVLANHVTNLGYEYLRKGKGQAEFDSAVSRNPLVMVMSPQNELQAVDGSGTVYYSMPFTTSVLPYANEQQKARIEALKKANEQQTLENDIKSIQNVQGGLH